MNRHIQNARDEFAAALNANFERTMLVLSADEAGAISLIAKLPSGLKDLAAELRRNPDRLRMLAEFATLSTNGDSDFLQSLVKALRIVLSDVLCPALFQLPALSMGSLQRYFRDETTPTYLATFLLTEEVQTAVRLIGKRNTHHFRDAFEGGRLRSREAEELQGRIIEEFIELIPLKSLTEGLRVLKEAQRVLEQAPIDHATAIVSPVTPDPHQEGEADSKENSLLDEIIRGSRPTPNLNRQVRSFVDEILKGENESSEEKVDLVFRELADFEPNRINQKAPDLRELLKIREKLKELRSQLTSVHGIERSLDILIARTKARSGGAEQEQPHELSENALTEAQGVCASSDDEPGINAPDPQETGDTSAIPSVDSINYLSQRAMSSTQQSPPSEQSSRPEMPQPLSHEWSAGIPEAAAAPFRCSVFFSERVTVKAIGRIIACVHLETVASQVARESAKRLELQTGSVLKAMSQWPNAPLPRHAKIDVTADIPGLLFEAPQASMHLWEDQQSVEFRFKAGNSAVGQACRGWIHFWLESVVLAEVPIVIFVVTEEIPEIFRDALAEANSKPYRRVFPSYSHQDAQIVRRIETYAESFGDQYLRDVNLLRAGQSWSAEIKELIEHADVFQLFWSKNAASSAYVEQEWRKGLTERERRPDPYFVRPVYWTEQPAPIPQELSHLHFAKASIL